MKNKVKYLFLVLIVAIMFVGGKVLSFGDGFNQGIYNEISNGTVNQDISDSAERITGTIATILQVLAIAGIVILGVRYMYAGSDDKARIKQTLIYAVVGLILVFGASSVIKIFISSGNDLLS